VNSLPSLTLLARPRVEAPGSSIPNDTDSAPWLQRRRFIRVGLPILYS
jgi:hypothetical protein